MNMDANQTLQRWQWLMLLVLLLTATLQITDLDQTGLWADEGWTIAATDVRSPLDVINDWVAVDVHPPLFFIELYGWRQFVGDSIFELRYFSVMLTLMATAVMYQAGRTIFHNRLVGVLAALFFGMHDLVHVLTQEVRHYPQQQLMVALALWMFWRLWERPSRWRGVGFVLAATALLWSHYWGGFVLLAMGIFTLITRWHQIRPYLLAFTGVGLAFVPWLPILYEQITYERPGGLPHALDNSWTVFKTVAFQLAGTPEIFWLGLALFAFIGPLIWAGRLDFRKLHPGSSLLLLIIVITIGLSIWFNEYYPTLSFRSLAVTIPALSGLVAYAIYLFRPPERLVLVAFVIAQSLLTTSAGPVERAPWPEVSTFLAQHSTAEDLILMELDTDEYNVEYYLNQLTDQVAYAHTETERELNPDKYDLAAVLADYDSAWLAKLDWYFYDVRADLWAAGLRQVSPVISWEPYLGRPIEVIRYARLPAADTPPVMTIGDRFNLADVDVAVHPNWVTVNLLWQPQENPDDFYTVSVFLLNQGGIPSPDAQHDSYPLDGRSPTNDWQEDEFYFDSHTLFTDDLPNGTYQIGVKIYRAVNGDYSNLEILPPSTCADPDCTYAILETITLE